MDRDHEIERMRRSLAMLRPGQPSGLSREDAIDLLRELQEVGKRLDGLKQELRRLAEDV